MFFWMEDFPYPTFQLVRTALGLAAGMCWGLAAWGRHRVVAAAVPGPFNLFC